MPVIPTIWEAEVGIKAEAGAGQKLESLSEKQIKSKRT
jgi:hypothetical protein